MNRSAPVVALALLAACTTPAPRPALDSPLPAGLAQRLARVRCLLVAPLENGSDEPLVAEAATGALAAALDRERVRIFPIGELRALFEETPLELPEGVPEPVAVELGDVLGADAVLYGTIAARRAGGAPEVTLTVRLAASGGRETLFLRSMRVVPAPGEPFVEVSRRAALEAAATLLEQLGTPGPHPCFDQARLDRVRSLARRQAPYAPGPSAPGIASGGRRPSLSRRQAAWAAKLAARKRFVVEDVAFEGRSPLIRQQAGLSDLVLALAATPTARVRIEGFVDQGANEAEDLRVSMEHARTAGRRLIELGVPRDRVTWAGRGRADPVAPGFTARGRLANRRLEVVVLAGGGAR